MIDQARLSELAEDFGEEDLEEIIEVFLAEALQAIDALEGRIESMDLQERREEFHFLKGCARNIGATSFGDLCERWELGTEPFAREDYSHLRAEFQAVCDHLKGRGLRLSA